MIRRRPKQKQAIRSERRKGIDRRQRQEPPVEGKYQREYGKTAAGKFDFHPLILFSKNQRKGKDRRKNK